MALRQDDSAQGPQLMRAGHGHPPRRVGNRLARAANGRTHQRQHAPASPLPPSALARVLRQGRSPLLSQLEDVLRMQAERGQDPQAGRPRTRPQPPQRSLGPHTVTSAGRVPGRVARVRGASSSFVGAPSVGSLAAFSGPGLVHLCHQRTFFGFTGSVALKRSANPWVPRLCSAAMKSLSVSLVRETYCESAPGTMRGMRASIGATKGWY